jgi:NADPH-dependent 2,4-dienoyl-CoA reductase/sulfur reductase-like enzyme
MRCHDSTVYGHHFQCSVNPTAGLENNIDKMIQPVEEIKKVAIIGGGPAGMKAALVANERGHQVTLFEQSDKLGGMLHYAGYFSFKYPVKDYMNWLIAQVEKSSVTVKLNTKATPDMVQDYDAVIVAIGAEPLILPIPGVDQVKPAIDVLGHEETLGDSVLVIGGGQVGCETALHFAKLGKKVTVVEMQSALAPDASTTGRNELMTEIEAEPNFVSLTGARCVAVTPTSVTYVKDGKEETVSADSVVLSSGMRAKSAEADTFFDCGGEISEVGDCVRARTIEWATKEAYYAAINL